MILVTGGAGTAGARMVGELLQAGHEVLVLDNFSTGSVKALQAVAAATGRDFDCVKGDVRDGAFLQRVFRENSVTSVVHCAFVGGSGLSPLERYENNLAGTLILLQVMDEFGVKRLTLTLGDADGAGAADGSVAAVQRMVVDVCAADSGWVVTFSH
ncbi:SDR family NAD(P)-dependent oxidoreductase [Pseudidiomarina woesei]|uniref:UDP-glucose 4-epimerase n=1 Tax=Pseudidiomarina woesei TaxID=1381080 RepID=A0A0K6GZL7_9GAMM|nr:SDR family NAD(P)-dependent oxidoreductase [Pseudidiomarina woesei]CUA83968.1 NAD dependent epimerase/dehydratase family [Pseudidiomarina woesei]